MIRVRRYRTFLAIAVVTLIGFYYLKGVGIWAPDSSFRASTLRNWASGRINDSSKKSAQGSRLVEEASITDDVTLPVSYQDLYQLRTVGSFENNIKIIRSPDP